MLLDGASGSDKARPSLAVDFQSALEMRRHELIDGVQLTELTVRSDDHRLRDCMTICAGRAFGNVRAKECSLD